MSVAILVWLLIEFIMQVKVRLRPDFSWQEIMLILIFLCLSCTSFMSQLTYVS